MAAPEKEGITREDGAPDSGSYPMSMTVVKTHAVIYVTLECDECRIADEWLPAPQTPAEGQTFCPEAHELRDLDFFAGKRFLTNVRSLERPREKYAEDGPACNLACELRVVCNNCVMCVIYDFNSTY